MRHTNMKRTTIIGLAAGGAAAAIAIAGGIAAASAGGDDDETPITGPALDRATAVALDHVGEGTITGTEEGDEDSYYEVEVTLADGSEIDVQLDRDFEVVGSEAEHAGEPDDD